MSSLDWKSIDLELDGVNDYGPCPDCGNMSRTVWGYASVLDEAIAAYFVAWTLNSPDHGAHFDLIMGKWDDDSTPQDRMAVSLEYRTVKGQGSFMIIDAATRPIPSSSLTESLLRRDQVIGKPIAQEAFALVDAIYMRDPRIDEIRHW